MIGFFFFGIIIFYTAITTPLIHEMDQLNDYEKRIPAPFPKFEASNIWAFPKGLKAYFNDAFAFRNIVLICMSVGLFSCIGYQAILKIPSSQVINQLPTIDILQPLKCKLIPVSGLEHWELCSPHCFTNSQFPNVQNF